MSKFCINCGMQLDDEMQFCIGCGANQNYAAPAAEAAPAEVAAPVTVEEPVAVEPVVATEPVAAPVSETPAGCKCLKKLSKNMIITIAAGAVALALVIGIVCLAFSGSYTSAVENIYSARLGNAELIQELAPQAYWDYMARQRNTTAEEYVQSLIDDAKEEMQDSDFTYQYGKDVDISFDVEKEVSLPQGQIEKIGRYLNIKYGINPNDVTDAKKLVGYLSLSSDICADTMLINSIYVLKIDGDWYAANLYYDDDADVWEVGFHIGA